MPVRNVMPRVTPPWWAGYPFALATVGLVSILVALVIGRTYLANISMVYLIAVLITAVSFGSGPAILASFASFLVFNWFFVEPIHTFSVADPEQWVSLLLFLLIATSTGQLAAAQRRRAQEAEQREREAIVLYDVVQLVNDPDLERSLQAVAQRLTIELQLEATVIELSVDGAHRWRAELGNAETLAALRESTARSSRMLSTGRAPSATQRGHPGRWVRIVPDRPRGPSQVFRRDRLHIVTVLVRGQRVGAISLVHTHAQPPFNTSDDRLLSAVAAQLSLAVERARLRQDATEAEILRRTDEVRTQLLNAVSHDLRTPLSSIIAAAGSLRQTDVQWSEQERQEFAQAIEDEAHRLNRIVGNLLDLSRIEGGSLRPARGWYDLSALIDDVVGRLAPLTHGRPVELDVPADLPPVLLDYVEIDQVLSNLVENAVKYTPAGEPIEIRVRIADDQVRVDVRDHGPGVPIEALHQVFEPFFTSANQRVRQPRGLGLGLAVVKGLVEAHGGRVSVENQPTGGACFSFTLPLETASETVAPVEAQPA